MRFWIRVPIAALAMGLYLELAVQASAITRPSLILICALGALAALFLASYLLGRWWLAALPALAANGLILTVVSRPNWGLMLSVGFAALVGWWSRRKTSWPLSPMQAFLPVAVLVMVSLSLSGILSLRLQPVSTNTPYAIAVLYLGTPPWEWVVVLTVLRRSQHLASFFRDHYRWTRHSWVHVGAGLGAGVGMIGVTAVLVAIESHGLHVHVRANNPFVYDPALRQHRWMASLLVALGVVVLAPIAEEALFRGVLFGTLAQRWGYLPGSVVAALIFGLAHLDWTLLIPLAVAGLILNALYHQTRSLIPSTIAHATLNLVSVGSALGMLGAVRL